MSCLIPAGVLGGGGLCLILSVALVSCGGDENEPGGGSNTTGTGGESGQGGSGTRGSGGGTVTGSGESGGVTGDGGQAGDDSGTGGSGGAGGLHTGSGGTLGTGGGVGGSAGAEGGSGGEEAGASLEVTPEDGGTLTEGTTTIVVPPGAVAEPTTITIRVTDASWVAEFPGNFERVGPVVALLPHGLTFAQPVQVTLGHTSETTLVDPAVLRLADDADTTWENIASPMFDADSVTYSTTTFSHVAPSVPTSTGCTLRLAITAVYTSGGRDAFHSNNDFVELNNWGTTPLSLNGLALQLNAATSTTAWTVVPLSGTVPPGGYYLVGLGREDLAEGSALPTPDVSSSYDLPVSGGRIALTRGTTPLSGSGPWSIESGVAYGASTLALEGTPAPAQLASGAMLLRLTCTHTGNNADDLYSANRRNPYNSDSEPRSCTCE